MTDYLAPWRAYVIEHCTGHTESIRGWSSELRAILRHSQSDLLLACQCSFSGAPYLFVHVNLSSLWFGLSFSGMWFLLVIRQVTGKWNVAISSSTRTIYLADMDIEYAIFLWSRHSHDSPALEAWWAQMRRLFPLGIDSAWPFVLLFWCFRARGSATPIVAVRDCATGRGQPASWRWRISPTPSWRRVMLPYTISWPWRGGWNSTISSWTCWPLPYNLSSSVTHTHLET